MLRVDQDSFVPFADAVLANVVGIQQAQIRVPFLSAFLRNDLKRLTPSELCDAQRFRAPS